MITNDDHLSGDAGRQNPGDLKLLLELAKKGCPTFYSVFTLVYPEFHAKLCSQAPRLNPDDLTVCAYTRLGFSTLQIAYYSKSTIRAIDSRKYRIRRNLNVPK